MKNFIDYYYNFNIYNIILNNSEYFFYNNEEKYLFKVCNKIENLKYYSELKKELNFYKYFFEIIINKENSYITIIENKPYILLKISNIDNDKLSIFDIKTNFYIRLNNNELQLLNYSNWARLWEKKIDYFEDWFYNKQDSYKKLYPLFHYFIGIAENAILYLKEAEKAEMKYDIDNLVVSHTRLTINYNLYDYYDPTNIIIDHPSRDISEYIKSMFINKMWDLDLLKNYLDTHEFSKYGIKLMLARIMFPSFFFDYIEDMIMKNSELDLLYLENRTKEFNLFLKQIITYFVEKYKILPITWIIKKHKY